MIYEMPACSGDQTARQLRIGKNMLYHGMRKDALEHLLFAASCGSNEANFLYGIHLVGKGKVHDGIAFLQRAIPKQPELITFDPPRESNGFEALLKTETDALYATARKYGIDEMYIDDATCLVFSAAALTSNKEHPLASKVANHMEGLFSKIQDYSNTLFGPSAQMRGGRLVPVKTLTRTVDALISYRQHQHTKPYPCNFC